MLNRQTQRPWNPQARDARPQPPLPAKLLDLRGWEEQLDLNEIRQREAERGRRRKRFEAAIKRVEA